MTNDVERFLGLANGGNEVSNDSSSRPACAPAQAKAGRLLRFLGWFQVVSGGVLAFLGLAGASVRRYNLSVLLIAGVVVAGIGGFHLRVGRGVVTGEPWARTAAIVLGVLMLPSLPIGTVFGGFILYYLFSDRSKYS